MGKRHLKRIAAPASWQVERKTSKFITRPNPGAHPLKLGLSLATLLKDFLKYGETSREARKVLLENDILVNGTRRKEKKFIAGLMDIISIPTLNEHYRILLNKNGKLILAKTNDKESKIKLSKITGKTKLEKNKLQINLLDGTNFIADKGNYGIGDTVVFDIPEKKPKEVLKLEKGAVVYITAGKYTGSVYRIEKIEGKNIFIKSKEGAFETLKEYAFVVGKDKPVISLNANYED